MIRYDLRRLLPRSAIVALCLVCLGAFHTPVSAAWTHAQGSNGWTIDWDGGRMQQTAQWMPATTTNAAGGASWAVSGGNLVGSGIGRINNGPGYIDVQAKVMPTKPTVAGALAKAMRKVGPLATGMALVDLATDLGYAISGSGDSIVFQKADPAVCTVAPCYAWRGTWSGAGTYSTQMAMCNAYSVWSKATAPTGGSYFTATGVYLTDSCTGGLYRKSDNSYIQAANATGIAARISAAPQPAAYLPSSEQEFIDSIALASGWPTSANFPKAVVEAIDSGELIPGPVTVTGPSTSQGSKITTTDSSGNVTEKQTVYNYNYSDNRVTFNTSTVTKVNNVVQSTEVKENEKPKDDCEGSNDARCADLDTPQTEVPKSTKNLTYAPEELGLGAGACPAPILLNTSRGNWSLDLTPYCNATATYVRPMVILVAMFLAYLIMTGHRFGGD